MNFGSVDLPIWPVLYPTMTFENFSLKAETVGVEVKTKGFSEMYSRFFLYFCLRIEIDPKLVP